MIGSTGFVKSDPPRIFSPLLGTTGTSLLNFTANLRLLHLIYSRLLIKFGMPHFLINFLITVFPILCVWIGSFLSNRRISIVVDVHSSNLHPLNAGVPQGSVLAPILFLFHINDLLSATTNPIQSYADESTLHSNIQSSQPFPML